MDADRLMWLAGVEFAQQCENLRLPSVYLACFPLITDQNALRCISCRCISAQYAPQIQNYVLRSSNKGCNASFVRHQPYMGQHMLPLQAAAG